jgi:hypothetical protein
LNGREGFGFLSPSRRACEAGFGAFVEVKRLFSTTSEAKKRRRKEITSVTGRGLGTTGTSGQWLQRCAAQGARACNRRVRSLAELERPITHLENSASLRADRTRWRVRSRATGRIRSTKSLSGTSLDSDWTLALSHPVMTWSASGHTLPESVTFCDSWKSNEQDSKKGHVASIGEVALVRPDAGCVRSIRPARSVSARRAAFRA